MGTRLFVGNLSYNVTELELKEAFTSEGIEVRSVRLACERETGRPRGFAFVETATDDGAKQSIEELNGRLVQGRALIVEEAQARPAPGAPRPGGPHGPPRFGGPRPSGGPRAQWWGPSLLGVCGSLVYRTTTEFRPAAPAESGAASAPMARLRAGANVPKRSAHRDPSLRNASAATGAGRASQRGLSDGITIETAACLAEGCEAPREIIPLRLRVPPECEGWRLDHFLKHRIRRLSRTKIRTIIEQQVRLADGRRPRPALGVRAGETIIVNRPAPVEPEVPRRFDILAEDETFLALDKPAGLPMHTTAKFWKNTLVALLRERFPSEALQICHRLDRETSGVLLVAVVGWRLRS